MTFNEYYGFPEGTNAMQRYALSSWYDFPNAQLPVNCNYLIARNNNGVFFLRIEDTDQKRELKEAVDLIKEALYYYGIVPNEYQLDGEIKGNYGPYVQSERKEIYHAFIKYLIEIGYVTEVSIGASKYFQPSQSI